MSKLTDDFKATQKIENEYMRERLVMKLLDKGFHGDGLTNEVARLAKFIKEGKI